MVYGKVSTCRLLTRKLKKSKLAYMRQSYDKETETRRKVIELINTRGRMQSGQPYYSPSRVKTLLEHQGVFVTLDYVIRRYKELRIKNIDGLYVKVDG